MAMMSWPEYREAHGITDAEDPAAFAAYLHFLSDGRWDDAGEDEPPPIRELPPIWKDTTES